MAEQGNPASVSDAGVGALAARAAVRGALLNVKINAAGLKDRELADSLVAHAEAIAAEAETFRLSTIPHIGIRRNSSASAIASSEIPACSVPKTSANGPRATSNVSGVESSR